MGKELECGRAGMLDFRKIRKVSSGQEEVLPVVVQDADSWEVLILAYANRQAVEHSLVSGTATFWSTSRSELWVKGLESGNSLALVEVRVNCEQNSLLYLVRRRKGGACHVRGSNGECRNSCYYRRVAGSQLDTLEFIQEKGEKPW